MQVIMCLRMIAHHFVTVIIIQKERLTGMYWLVFTVGAMAEVAALNRSDLEDLLACDDKLTEFVLALPQMAAARNQCDQLAAQNEAVASEKIVCSNMITSQAGCVTF